MVKDGYQKAKWLARVVEILIDYAGAENEVRGANYQDSLNSFWIRSR